MRRRDIFIVVWVMGQILLPASYYLRTEREARYDERFAWRMFSDIRMLSCKAEFRRGGAEVSLSSEFHTAWSSLLKRGRMSVVDSVGTTLCERYPDEPVSLKMSCREPDKSVYVVSTGDTDLCKAAR